MQIKKIEAKKWKIVSDNMKNMKPVTNFSQRACRERFEALETGTAKVPPELVEDKTEDILNRIQSRKNKESKLASYKMVGSDGTQGVGYGAGDNSPFAMSETPVKKGRWNANGGAQSETSAAGAVREIAGRSRSTRLSTAAATELLACRPPRTWT